MKSGIDLFCREIEDRITGDKTDDDLGMEPLKARQSGDQPAHAERGRRRYVENASTTLSSDEFERRLLELIQRAADFIQIFGACGGERNALLRALEEPDVQRFLEEANLAA